MIDVTSGMKAVHIVGSTSGYVLTCMSTDICQHALKCTLPLSRLIHIKALISCPRTF